MLAFSVQIKQVVSAWQINPSLWCYMKQNVIVQRASNEKQSEDKLRPCFVLPVTNQMTVLLAVSLLE